jgi:hypothetical protein
VFLYYNTLKQKAIAFVYSARVATVDVFFLFASLPRLSSGVLSPWKKVYTKKKEIQQQKRKETQK